MSRLDSCFSDSTVMKKVVLETNIDESYFGAELTMFPGFYWLKESAHQNSSLRVSKTSPEIMKLHWKIYFPKIFEKLYSKQYIFIFPSVAPTWARTGTLASTAERVIHYTTAQWRPMRKTTTEWLLCIGKHHLWLNTVLCNESSHVSLIYCVCCVTTLTQ